MIIYHIIVWGGDTFLDASIFHNYKKKKVAHCFKCFEEEKKDMVFFLAKHTPVIFIYYFRFFFFFFFDSVLC